VQSCAPQKLDRPPTRASVTAGRGFGGLLSQVLCIETQEGNTKVRNDSSGKVVPILISQGE
jgi:hypothetical protein